MDTTPAETGPVAGDVWQDWPHCPKCNERRQAECPVCHHASNAFPLAPYLGQVEAARPSRMPGDGGEAESSAAEILFMCTECDEAFAPRFYDQCAACGYEAGFGLRSPDWLGREQWNFRMTLVAMSLMGSLTAMLYYFYWVLN